MSWRDEFQSRIPRLLDARIADGKPIRILEVGGGDQTHFQTELETEITVIDISEEQLQRNRYASKKILGDIMDVKLENNHFDVAFFWNVLEHLEDPRAAIERVARAVDENGLIVIVGPNPHSLKGMVAKFSPHLVHILFYRHVLKRKNAGSPGYGPFPTFLNWNVNPNSLESILKESGFGIEYKENFVGNQVRSLKRESFFLYLIYLLLSYSLRVVSFGRIGHLFSDFILITQKNLLSCTEPEIMSSTPAQVQ